MEKAVATEATKKQNIENRDRIKHQFDSRKTSNKCSQYMNIYK